jgi:hypothetical protein
MLLSILPTFLHCNSKPSRSDHLQPNTLYPGVLRDARFSDRYLRLTDTISPLILYLARVSCVVDIFPTSKNSSASMGSLLFLANRSRFKRKKKSRHRALLGPPCWSTRASITRSWRCGMFTRASKVFFARLDKQTFMSSDAALRAYH